METLPSEPGESLMSLDVFCRPRAGGLTNGHLADGVSMPTPSNPADSRRLYQQVADQIRTVIDESRFAPGTRLPPERELALQLGVSRPSLREALIALEIDGVVEIRM